MSRKTRDPAADDEDLTVASSFQAGATSSSTGTLNDSRSCSTASSTHVEEEAPIGGAPVTVGMSPRSTSAATMPAKFAGDFAAPNCGA